MAYTKYTQEQYQEFLKEFNPTLIIGEGVDWSPVTLSLKQIVHLLFWGQSWSWKSVFVLQLIFQLLFLTNPKSLQLILVDPLRVSFKDFKYLPHLLCPVASTAQEAVDAVSLMMNINRERYQFFENIWFENVYDYNEALAKDKIPYKDGPLQKTVSLSEIPDEYIEKTATQNYRLWEPMSQVIIFMDEFNAIMMQPEFWWKTPSEASSPALKNITWVSEQARKAWIIIIVGTQKIDANSLPTKIRGNLKTRICLKVATADWSTAILSDAPENRRDWFRLTWYGDGLVFNEDLNPNEAVRFQSAMVHHEDMLDLVNAFITAYWQWNVEYQESVSEEYARSSEDLEPQPISYDIWKVGLPPLLTVRDSIFCKPEWQKLLSEVIRSPFLWDDKVIQLRYPSIKSADLKSMRQRLVDVWILGNNEQLGDDGEPIEGSEGYFWLNLKMKWLEEVLIRCWFTKDLKDTWDLDSLDYQDCMMKLCIIHLNRYYIAWASNISYSISDYDF